MGNTNSSRLVVYAEGPARLDIPRLRAGLSRFGKVTLCAPHNTSEFSFFPIRFDPKQLVDIVAGAQGDGVRSKVARMLSSVQPLVRDGQGDILLENQVALPQGIHDLLTTHIFWVSIRGGKKGPSSIHLGQAYDLADLAHPLMFGPMAKLPEAQQLKPLRKIGYALAATGGLWEVIYAGPEDSEVSDFFTSHFHAAVFATEWGIPPESVWFNEAPPVGGRVHLAAWQPEPEEK